MPASIFSETELARLASFPEEIPSDDLIRAFTLTGADRDLVVIRRGAANRLGLALQLCALRYLGFVPRNLSAAPRSAACFVADQLEVSPDEIQSYARREQTRRQHFTEVREHLGFSMLRSRDLEELEAWLVERALEHDAPKVLFRLARERLRRPPSKRHASRKPPLRKDSRSGGGSGAGLFQFVVRVPPTPLPILRSRREATAPSSRSADESDPLPKLGHECHRHLEHRLHERRH